MFEKNTDNLYDLSYWLNSSLSDLDVSTEQENIKALIIKNGFEIIDFNNLGRRDFSYEIKHNGSGYFCTIRFKGSRGFLLSLKKELDFNKQIVRYLIVNYQEQPIVSPGPRTVRKPASNRLVIETEDSESTASEMPEEMENKEFKEKSPNIDIDFDNLDKKLEEILKE